MTVSANVRSGFSSDVAGYAALVTALQSVTSEIQIDRLLATLLHTILDTTGATKGVILLPRESQWHVEAIATLVQPAQIKSVPLSDSSDVPHGLIHTTERSRQPVVMADAATTHFTNSVDGEQPKSVLCLPMLQQDAWVAILYLEHASTGTFTSDRLAWLNVLCAQAAISLKNARLFSSLQTQFTQLQQSEARLRRLFERSADAMLILDPEQLIFTDCNPSAASLLGYATPEAVIGLGPMDISPEVQPNGQSSSEMAQEMIALTFAQGSHRFEWCHRSTNGLIWLEVVLTRLSFDDQPVFLCVWRDISKQQAALRERQAAEANLQEKVRLLSLRSTIDSTLTQDETLSDMLQHCTQAIVDHLGVAFARIWTLNEAEQMLELQASAGIYTHINGPHRAVPVGKFKIGLIAQEQQPHLTNDVLTDPRVGDKEWARREGMVAFAGYPLKLNDRLLGVLAMFARQPLPASVLDTLSFVANDISIGIERQQTAAVLQSSETELQLKAQALEQSILDLKQAQIQMVQSEKMASLGNLVAGIAHEINNPIGFLNGSLNNARDYIADLLNHLALYQQQYPNPIAPVQNHAEAIDLEFLRRDLPKLLNSMKGATERIKGISTSLRTFSRADTEHKISVNLHEGLDSTLLILKYRLKANQFRPEIQVIQNYGELPLVRCFPGQLNQVFMNILANAIDMFDEQIQTQSLDLNSTPQQITLCTERINHQVAVRIRDNGIGIDPEIQTKIFDHLFTTKGVGKGTGLGLAIARQIVVEKHGGSLEVKSEVGRGTEFLIQLPIDFP